jgi:hypothetical protein
LFANGTDLEHSLERKIHSLYPSLNIMNMMQKVRFRQLEKSHHKENIHDIFSHPFLFSTAF